ncbi:hypothetical protein TYRP_009294 [Tyrophagus putrescentiae]|nr:hypothetical protein TYRP_009294 [Tyrophagus putrescentiae]
MNSADFLNDERLEEPLFNSAEDEFADLSGCSSEDEADASGGDKKGVFDAEMLFQELRKRREVSALAIKEGGLSPMEVMYSCLFKIGHLVGSGNFEPAQLLKDFDFLATPNNPDPPLCGRCRKKPRIGERSAGAGDKDSTQCNRCFAQGYFDAMQDIAAGNITSDIGSANNEKYLQMMSKLLNTDLNGDSIKVEDPEDDSFAEDNHQRPPPPPSSSKDTIIVKEEDPDELEDC